MATTTTTTMRRKVLCWAALAALLLLTCAPAKASASDTSSTSTSNNNRRKKRLRTQKSRSAASSEQQQQQQSHLFSDKASQIRAEASAYHGVNATSAALSLIECKLRLMRGAVIHPETQKHHQHTAVICVDEVNDQALDVFQAPNLVEEEEEDNNNKTSLVYLAKQGSSFLQVQQRDFDLGNVTLHTFADIATRRTPQQERNHRLLNAAETPLVIEAEDCHSGVRKVRLICVNFKDRKLSKPCQQWKNEIWGREHTPFTQLTTCSGGAVEFELLGVDEVTIPNSVWEYQTFRSNLFTMTKVAFAKIGMESKTCGDHCLFMVPPATNNPSNGFRFPGVADVNGPKVVMQEQWSSDLIVGLHEMGHNCGFGHSNLPEDLHAGDVAFAMGATGAGERIGYPRKCNSPVDIVRAGWLRARTHFLTLQDVREGIKINLAGFTQIEDFRKKDTDPVVVAFDDYRLMLVMTDAVHTDGTESHINKVVITKVSGNAGDESLLVGAIGVKERVDIDGIIFRVCAGYLENDGSSRFKSVHLSIGQTMQCKEDLPSSVTGVYTADGQRRHLGMVTARHGRHLLRNYGVYDENGQERRALKGIAPPETASAEASSSSLRGGSLKVDNNNNTKTNLIHVQELGASNATRTFNSTRLSSQEQQRSLNVVIDFTPDGSAGGLVSFDGLYRVQEQPARPTCKKIRYKMEFEWPWGKNGPKNLTSSCPWLVKKQAKTKTTVACPQLNLKALPTERFVWQYCQWECFAWAQCMQ